MKIGDKVKVIDRFANQALKGYTGKIIVYEKGIRCGVEFEENIRGHSCDNKGELGHCRWGSENELQLIDVKINIRKLNKELL